MDLGHKETDKILERLEKELNRMYGQVYEEIFDKYKKTLFKLKASKKAEDILYNKTQKKKFELLLKQIAIELNNTNKTALGILNDEMLEIYALNNQYAVYELMKESGYFLSLTIYNKNIIKKILEEGSNIFSLMAIDDLQDRNLIIRELRRELAVALVEGEGIPNIAKRIKEITEKNKYNCIRIARTETTRVQNMARQDVYKDAEEKGIKLKKQWISTLDTRTRRSHQHLNGQVRELNEPFSNGLQYPGEPTGKASEVINCRCTTVSNIIDLPKTEMEIKLEERLKKKNFELFREEFG